MSVTSTSSDSEQVSLEDFLESCRPPTLLGELDDDEDMDDDNVDDENEDEYEEVSFVIYTVILNNKNYNFFKNYSGRKHFAAGDGEPKLAFVHGRRDVGKQIGSSWKA